MDIYLRNTITKNKEKFIPIKQNEVGIYHCGPTVYWTQHIGNMRAVVIADFLNRMFRYNGYKVKLVRNYTDVGHLTGDNLGDADTGEDRMEKASKREGLSPEEIALKYIKIYNNDIKSLNTIKPEETPRATSFIKEMIEMVSKLLENGNAYTTDLAIYFDIKTFKDYTKLSGQKLEKLEFGAGTGDVSDPNKKDPRDFALWFFKAGVHKNILQSWKSPFKSPLVEDGEGFPGWHIECSAMSKYFLGETFDIHMGGVEHIPIHHSNEIAQSECANHKHFVNYWLHNEHLLVDDKKMSKSEGTSFTVEDIIKKDIEPLALRYFFLQSHYRSKQNFTWESLLASQTALKKIRKFLNSEHKISIFTKIKYLFSTSTEYKRYQDEFLKNINDDLNTAEALAVVWNVIGDEKINVYEKKKLILKFDKFLGLKLDELPSKKEEEKIPQNILDLAKDRDIARKEKDFKKADMLREEISKLGFEIKDAENKTIIVKK